MIGYKNPATRRLDIPFALYTTPTIALEAIAKCAHSRDWEKTAHIRPVDERVVWTIHEDHVELYYRERPA